MKDSIIEDIYDSYYDSYLDNLQDSLDCLSDVYYECSYCHKECLPVEEDNSFGYEYGSQIATHKQVDIISDCCGAKVLAK